MFIESCLGFRQYSRYFKQRDTLDSFYPQAAHYPMGETSQWLRCHNHSLQRVLGTQKGTQLSTNVKAASAKGSHLSWVLKEPGTYRTRTGGHWWCRARRSLFQRVGTARRWGRCMSDGVGGEVATETGYRVQSPLRAHRASSSEMHLGSQQWPRWAPTSSTPGPQEATLSSEPSLSKDKGFWGKTLSGSVHVHVSFLRNAALQSAWSNLWITQYHMLK